MTNYKGFELFDDIEDEALRNRNRAVVLSNIAEDHTKNRLVSPKGASLMLGYFQAIPVDARKVVRDLFESNMRQRGYATLTGT
jgi:hypothetical protein